MTDAEFVAALGKESAWTWQQMVRLLALAREALDAEARVKEPEESDLRWFEEAKGAYAEASGKGDDAGGSR